MTMRPAASGAVEEMRRLFTLQSTAQSALRHQSPMQRKAKLDRLRAVIEDNMEAVLAALAEDLNKPREEAMADFGAPLWEIDLIDKGLEEWMKPIGVTPQASATPGATAKIVHEPKGKILIFGPWNFPFALSMQPLVAAVAAGNTVILKPSELAPATAAVIARIISESFPQEEVAVLEGGVDVAEALLELPFDHVFFTGSPGTGRRVMAAASNHLSSITLELGGKCPAIVDDGVDLAQVAKDIVRGKFFNAGQICLAPDHIWVSRAVREIFVAHLEDEIDALYWNGGAFRPERMARIINDANIKRLSDLLDDAIARGATLLRGGLLSGKTLEPTILLDVPLDARIMQEEIFGPILPIITFSDDETMARAINDMGKPLALYVFSQRQAFIDSVLAKTMSGGVTVNGVMLHASDAGLPFGGVGSSGMGAYHGIHSFAELTHRRSIFVQPVTSANM